MRRILALVLFVGSVASASTYDFRILSTFRSSTMEKEMNEAAESGFIFADVMGGDNPSRRDEVVVVMQRNTSVRAEEKRTYQVIAAARTSNLEKELQRLGDAGYEYRAQTEFQSGSAGREIALIMERVVSAPAHKIEYRLLGTTRRGTMEKELREAGNEGFHLASMMSAKGFFGPSEICILRKD